MISKGASPLKREYILHVLLWGAVLLFPYIKFIEREGGYPETLMHELNSILFIIIPSYAFYAWWLPLAPHKRLKWLPILIITFVGTILTYEYTDSLFHGSSFQPFSWAAFLSDVIKNSAFILFFLVLYLVKGILMQKQELKRISDEKKQVEKEMFKVQEKKPITDRVHLIYADKTTYKVKSSEILYLKAEIDYVRVVTKNREILVLDSLRRWKGLLAEQGFVQSHRSYLVRIEAIFSISKGTIELKEHTLPIGPSFKSDLMDAFKNRMN